MASRVPQQTYWIRLCLWSTKGALLALRWVAAGGVAQLAVVVGEGEGRVVESVRQGCLRQRFSELSGCVVVGGHEAAGGITQLAGRVW